MRRKLGLRALAAAAWILGMLAAVWFWRVILPAIG